MDPDRMKLYLEHCYGVVQRHGWMVQGVMPVKGETWKTPFYYSAGLTLHKRPEIVLSCALDPAICMDLVNQVGQQFLGTEAPIVPGMMLEFQQPHSPLMPVMPIRVAALDPQWVAGNVTLPGRLGFGEPTAFQVLWPDRNGFFPGDSDYSMNPDVQKVLSPALL